MQVPRKLLPRAADLAMHGIFWLAVCGSVAFWPERLSGNGGLDIFNAIDSGRFFLIHNRLTHLFGQAVPLLALKTGCSLKTVLIAFSVSAPLVHYLLFLTARYALSDRYAAMGIALVQFTGIGYSFFNDPQLEIQYCLSGAFLFYALAGNQRIRPSLFTIATALISVFTLLSYPPAFLPLACVYLVRAGDLDKFRLVATALTFAACLLVAYAMLDSYESSVLSHSLAGEKPVNPLRALPGYFGYLFAEYRFECLLGAGAILAGAWKRQFAGVLLPLAFAAAYALLILEFYGANYRLEHINLAVLFFATFAFVHILPGLSPLLRYGLFFLAWLHVWANGREVTGRIAGLYREHTTLLTGLIEESQCIGNNLFILDDPRLDSMDIIPPAYFQQSVLLSAAGPAIGTRGILPAAALTENLNSLQLPVNAPVIDSLLATGNTRALTGYVNTLAADRFPLSPVFGIADFDFAWLTTDQLCR